MSESFRNSVALETIASMGKHEISKVIWDIRDATVTYSLIGSHSAVLDLKSLGVADTDSIAVIYRNDQEQHEHSSTVAGNRGIRNLKYFRDLPEGIDWLFSR